MVPALAKSSRSSDEPVDAKKRDSATVSLVHAGCCGSPTPSHARAVMALAGISVRTSRRDDSAVDA
jgi:hypothetical protein